MVEIAVLLGVAAAGFGAAHYFKLPAIPFLLAAGLALGATTLLADQDFVEDVLLLGVTLLLFIAGTDLSARRVGKYKALAIEIGVVQFAVLSLAGIGAASALGYLIVDSLYIGLALAASSTLVGVRLLQKRQQMFEPFGRTVIGILLVQDLLIVLLIPVLTRISDGATAIALGVLGTLALAGLAWVMVQYIAPKLIVDLDLDNESLLLVILSVLFGFMGLGWLMDVPLISAAFLAGVSLSGFPVSGLVHGQLRPIYDFFVAVFLTALGVVIVAPGVVNVGHAIIFSLVVILITPLLVILLAERNGTLSARPAIESGLLVAQTSEFSLVVVLQGLVLNQVSPDLFTTIALTTVITMMLTPFLTDDRVVWQFMRWHPLSRERRAGTSPSNHVVLLGAGKSAQRIIDELQEADVGLVVVDEDPGVIDQLRKQGLDCIRGDGGDQAVLRKAGVHRACAIVSMIRRPLDIEPLFRYVDDEIPVLVRVFEDNEADRIRELGGTPILFSHAAADAFFEWFDNEHTISKPATEQSA